jgi:hypothetical protein
MPSQSRGRAIGADVVSYRRRSVDPTAQPERERNAYHADGCDCPRPQCKAQRANNDPPPEAA